MPPCRSASDGPALRAPARAAGALAGIGAVVLAALYAAASFGLAPDLDLTRFSSGILDMDVSRLVRDWGTRQYGARTNTHPLYKILLAPLGVALQPKPTSTAHALDAVRAMIATSVALHGVAVGILAAQLARGSLFAGVAAGALCGVSFSSLLAGTIPEGAAFACWGAVLPLILAQARRRRLFEPGEAIAWAVLGVLSFGFTVSQLSWWGVAFASRILLARRDARRGQGPDLRSPRDWLEGPVLAVGLAIAFCAGAMIEQERLYPGTSEAARRSVFETERAFLRVDRLADAPLDHLGLLARHFVLDDFAAPHPAPSDYLIESYELDYWSLSIEETSWSDRSPAQLVLAVGVLAFVLIGAAGAVLRWDVAFAAPAAGLGIQFALHAVYGREYVLYSLHWHGVLVAVLVAGAWRAFGRNRRILLLGWTALALALLVNNWHVLDGIYREFEAGLDRSLRDDRGRLLEPGAAASTAPPAGAAFLYSPARASRRSMVSAYSWANSSITERTDFTWLIDPTIWPTK